MAQHLRKPDWLKIRLGGNEQFTKTKSIVESHCLHTICTSGKCPNMGECWSRGTATFMIGGEICTRSCRFCNTLTGKPLPLDPKEPANVAESIRLMNLTLSCLHLSSFPRKKPTDKAWNKSRLCPTRTKPPN